MGSSGQEKSSNDEEFVIKQILEISWELNDGVMQLFVYYKQAYDIIIRKVLFPAIIELGIKKKLVNLTNITMKSRKGSKYKYW